MKPTPSFSSIDRALVVVAKLASKSAKLTAAEKRELGALAVKGAKSGQKGFTMADRARCAWLIRKAGPESIPDVKIPDRVKRLLKWGDGDGTPTEPQPSLRGVDRTLDPLERLEKLGRLRGKPLSEDQFNRQRARILEDPDIGAFGTAHGVDPLDRLTRVGELQAADVLTSGQAVELTERILNAT